MITAEGRLITYLNSPQEATLKEYRHRKATIIYAVVDVIAPSTFARWLKKYLGHEDDQFQNSAFPTYAICAYIV
jgi:hypothetical protein